jgi:CheY-like chemotaxis protein
MNGRQSPQVVPIDQVPPAEKGEYRHSILVVDDESAIADTMSEILSRSGYLAIPTYDAEQALETALITPPELLITDVMLPGMSGIELAITMRRIFPDCKILLCSGQAIALDLHASAQSKGHHFTLLSKPVHPREILAKVAECFAPANGSSSRVAPGTLRAATNGL